MASPESVSNCFLVEKIGNYQILQGQEETVMKRRDVECVEVMYMKLNAMRAGT